MSEYIPLSFSINTERLLLCKPSLKDIPGIFEASQHEGFTDGMLWEPPKRPKELEAPLERNLENWRQNSAYAFSCYHQISKDFIGRVSIRPAGIESVWDIGFFVHPKFHNQGYVTEAVNAILDFGFTKLDAIAIEACHATWNKASRRVLEKLGMEFVEHIPNGFKKNGEWVEEDRLRILKEGWQQRSIT